jgi:hypothetical protein
MTAATVTMGPFGGTFGWAGFRLRAKWHHLRSKDEAVKVEAG